MFEKIFIQNPIKTARKNLKMTQKEFAEELNEFLDKNLTAKDICRWEKCEHKPNQEILITIAKISNQDPAKFINAVTTHFEQMQNLIKRSKCYANS